MWSDSHCDSSLREASNFISQQKLTTPKIIEGALRYNQRKSLQKECVLFNNHQSILEKTQIIELPNKRFTGKTEELFNKLKRCKQIQARQNSIKSSNYKEARGNDKENKDHTPKLINSQVQASSAKLRVISQEISTPVKSFNEQRASHSSIILANQQR